MFIKYCVFFPRILESLSPFPRQHSAAIDCTKTYQPIGVTVHSHCVREVKVSYSDVGEEVVAVNCEKTHFFVNNLYMAKLGDRANVLNTVNDDGDKPCIAGVGDGPVCQNVEVPQANPGDLNQHKSRLFAPGNKESK